MKVLGYRMLTVGMVLAHYLIVEKVPRSEMVRNESELLSFILLWHLVFMFLKMSEESHRKKHKSVQTLMVFLNVVIGGSIALVVVATPLLAWMDFSVALLDSSYYTLRYLYMFLYITMNVAASVLPLLSNFVFFLTDGIILSQLTSLYLFNEFSITAFISIAPVLFVVQNHFLIRGVNAVDKDKAKGKLSFVILIGKHDAVFLFVIYSFFIFVMNLLDTVTVSYVFGVNLWYNVFTIYAFGKLMEGKNFYWLRVASFLALLTFTSLFIYTMRFHSQPFPDRTFPLYVRPNVTVADANATVEETVMNLVSEVAVDGGFVEL
mmetsp:Transcript_23707/g.18126  ORF Transcript_23707/g.18126 Transcript_23707/m.18126 type:complete len:320 (+) Transcript_23707:99-1058(+)|eukprot:CAMPEP_0202971068 /NCGR_PEP_ID=MMETSP1396-20130829/23241_1 /ASSEMBLY_ACC=CAM_ASM_000872 /TAXON_ID= /ORGANISM="Pseudokeronopsis sp., Strain Brazil" /LENGTH=319 /DNA_ID=CAMNT_0049700051 /DNA_START=95 /DNA_END=1054 /DNA_ORIENTATION=-